MSDPSGIKGNKSGIKLRKDSNTYKLFEQLFLDLGEEQLPYTLSGLTKGQAVNLAMGLNRCHIQWAKEAGVPENMITRSAKAKVAPSGDWFLEISMRGQRQVSSGEWIKNLIAVTPSTEEPSTPPVEEGPDASEQLLAQLYGKGI